MSILAIDPGSTRSAWVLLAADGRPEAHGISDNERLLGYLRNGVPLGGGAVVSQATGAPGWALQSAPLQTCILCGHEGPDVRHGLIRWRDGDPFGSGPRCKDRDACWQRVMDQDEDWPVDDGRRRGRVVEPVVKVGADRADFIPGIIPEPEPAQVPELDFGAPPEASG